MELVHSVCFSTPQTTLLNDVYRFPSYQIFRRGAYYTSDLIPGKLAAISLNTLYFYENNKAVGGCEWVNRAEVGGESADPGNLELDWFEVQLELFRQKKMKVWIIGHVPPSPVNYYPECYWRYSEIVLRFQDTIVGQIFGHMNWDYFTYVGTKDLQKPPEEEGFKSKKKELYSMLMKSFSKLDDTAKLNMDTYSIIHTSPSIVPNPYLPSMRVWGYNVSGLDLNSETVREADGGAHPSEAEDGTNKKKKKKKKPKEPDTARPGKKRCKKLEDKYKWWCQLPEREWFTDEDAPSRKNGPLSPLGYTQFWVPKLDDERPTWEFEYATYDPSRFVFPDDTSPSIWLPIPPKLIPNTTVLEERLPYRLPDGTVESWMDLARRIGDSEEMQEMFYWYMYFGDKPR